jgi:hypothetical protein
MIKMRVGHAKAKLLKRWVGLTVKAPRGDWVGKVIWDNGNNVDIGVPGGIRYHIPKIEAEILWSGKKG